MKPQIPEQKEGGQTDTTASIQLNSAEEAKQFFTLACSRLSDVNNWQKVCDSDATHFALFDAEGLPATRTAAEGDYFRINIPGPGNSAGEGFDWVRVEEMRSHSGDDDEVYYIRVRPAEAPVNNDKDVAHFFKDKATSTFMINRTGNTVIAGVHGRNEKPNTDTSRLTDKVRNALVGTASLLGFSLPQWKMLVEGLVRK
jgi:hypothetical protein